MKRSKLKDLQHKIVLQEQTRGRLEHALVLKSKTGIAPKHKIHKKNPFFGGEVVDSIETYKMELVGKFIFWIIRIGKQIIPTPLVKQLFFLSP